MPRSPRGGGLHGFLGGPEVNADTSVTAEDGGQRCGDADGVRAVRAVRDHGVASTEAERRGGLELRGRRAPGDDGRTLHNDNDCYATTYYVRRVSEAYEAITRVDDRVRRDLGPWRSLDDRAAPTTSPSCSRRSRPTCPRSARRSRTAGRSRCRPTARSTRPSRPLLVVRAAPRRPRRYEIRARGDGRARAAQGAPEVELLALELGRRRALDAAGEAAVLDVGSWPLGGSGAQAPATRARRPITPGDVGARRQPASAASAARPGTKR